jgi:DNA-binding Lrp family transcriptional regulator
MSGRVKIDNIDVKILQALIKDARSELKDIAKDCGVSCVAISNRIKRLKKTGVITGAVMFPNLSKLGGAIIATIGINVESGEEEEIQEIIQEQLYLIEPSVSIGCYDLFALVTARNINELQKTVQMIKKHDVVKRITVNIWVPPPHNNFENIDLQPENS